MPAQPWRSVPLRLPLDNDTAIEVPPIGWGDGLKLRQLLNQGETEQGLSLDSDDQVLAELCMGPAAWRQLSELGVSFPVAFRAGVAAIQYQVSLIMGQPAEVAVAAGETAWEAGLSPEAIAVAIATAMQSETDRAATDSTNSTSTDVASETPSPASTSGTTSPKTTRRKSPTKRAASGRSRSKSSSGNGTSSPPTSPASTESDSSSDPS